MIDKKYINGAIGLTKSFLNIGIAPVEVRQERLRICLSCEYYVEKRYKKCGVCGCYLIPKIKLKSESCPKGKWKSIT